MSSAGLHAKRGMEFQDYVAVYHSLLLLVEPDRIFVQAESLNLPGASNAVHVDDVIIGRADGWKTFIQVKMSAPEMKAWTISTLHGAGELKKIFDQLSENPSHIVELVCLHGFSELEELHRSIGLYDSTQAMIAMAAESMQSILKSVCTKIQKPPVETVDLVRRLKFSPRHDIDGWERECLKLLDGIADKDTAFAVMLKLLIGHQTKKNGSPSLITKSTVRDALSTLPRVTSADEEIGERLWRSDALRKGLKVSLVPEIYGVEPYDELPVSGRRMEIMCRQKVVGDKRHHYSRAQLNGQDIEFPTFCGTTGNSYARTEFGICSYRRVKASEASKSFLATFWSGSASSRFNRRASSNYRCESFTHVFQDGEIWMFDLSALKGMVSNQQGEFLLPSDLETRYACALSALINYNREARISPPFEVVVIIEGIGDTVLTLPGKSGAGVPEFSRCEGHYGTESRFELHSYDDDVSHALRPFFENIYGLFFRHRPDYIVQQA